MLQFTNELSKIAFVLTNSVDSDEMPRYVAFHLSMHCFPKYACKYSLFAKVRM